MDNLETSIEDKIVRVLTKQALPEELAEVRQWISESDDNRKLYDKYAAIWGISRAVGRNDDYQPDTAWEALNQRMKSQKHDKQHRISIKKLMVAAAMVVIIFLAGMALQQFTGNSTTDDQTLSYTEYTLPYGSKSKIKLPDGSSVWLNAGSTLRYASNFNTHCREVYLEGEAYFIVTRNEQTPFLVQTSTITIKVLGTEFNVNAYPEEPVVETIVESGVVQLIDPSSSKETTILRAKQKAVIVKSDIMPEKQTSQDAQLDDIKPLDYIPIAKMEVDDNVRTEAYTSWKDTLWVIEREKLSSLAVKLERRYNVHFVFVDEELRDYVFSGKFEKETLDQILEVMKLTAPILYKIEQNMVYLNRNKTIHP